MPPGDYAVVALADGWARGVATRVAMTGDQALTLELTHLADGALLFDGITDPGMGGAGGRVDISASAASALGDPLTFEWTVHGPDVQSLDGRRRPLRRSPPRPRPACTWRWSP